MFTEYRPPLVISVGKVQVASPVTKRSSPALSCNSSVSPGAHYQTNHRSADFEARLCANHLHVATFAFAVPVPFTTEQICGGFEGCVRTVTV